MSPAVLLAPQPGETILDTCAAPGGKTCQIAAAMQGEGLLITNDISASRAKALLRNVEISGIRNAIILCEDPPKLVGRFAGSVQRILVDAPCSGEGMFRKNEGGAKGWEPDAQGTYHGLQEPLLEAAGQLLAPGGTLVYSTCTFNRFENEDILYGFLKRHPEFTQAPAAIDGLVPGFGGEEGECPSAIYRLWPHLADGEGHFLARLQKAGGPGAVQAPEHALPHPPEAFREFAETYLPGWRHEGNYRMVGERLMLVPPHRFDFTGLRIVREGWHLGDIRKGRFEPSPALAMGIEASEFTQRLDFDPDNPDLIRYIKGETLQVEGPRGWILITVSGYPLGWAKGVEGFLKNHYPAAWRRLD